MKNLEFNITERCEKGSKVRCNGEIPCVLYGQNLDKSISAKISKKEMLKLLNYNESPVLALNINGKHQKCVLKELQRDPFGNIIHIDFQCVNKGDTIKLKVAVNFVGQEELESKRLLVEEFISEIPLQGKASEIPQNIEINVSDLDYGDQILAKNLNIPENVKLDINEDLMIAKVGSLDIKVNLDEEQNSDENVFEYWNTNEKEL